MAIRRKSIIMESNLGNKIEIRLTKLDNGNYEFLVDERGFILKSNEFKKLSDYIKEMT